MIGAAVWGGAWGHCGWGHNDININVNNNFNRNTNVNRGNINSGNRGGGNNWQHNSQHRGGAPYADKATANKYGGQARGDSLSSRQSSARQQQSRGGASAVQQGRGGAGGGQGKLGGGNFPSTSPNVSDRAASGSRGGGDRGAGAGSFDRGGSGGGSDRIGSRDVGGGSSRATARARGAVASAAPAATAAAARERAAHADPPASEEAEAAAAVEVVAVAAADGGVEVSAMKSRTGFPFVAALAGALLLSSPVVAAEAAKPAQQTFPSAKAAAEALVSAAEKFDVEALKAILGPEGIDLVVTEDAVQDRNQATAFAATAREKLVVSTDPKNAKKATMITGSGDWPMPIPIVKTGSTWRFDTVSGRQEMLLRRIGRNELDAIQICRGYVEAQHEYAAQEARRGAREPVRPEDHQHPGPTGRPGMEERGRHLGTARWARTSPASSSRATPTRRSRTTATTSRSSRGRRPSAPLGEMDFVVQGAMIGGFALVAAPADYEKTGIKTFIVSHDGVVWEKDLGPKTLEAFKAMELFNPDKSWSPVEEN